MRQVIELKDTLGLLWNFPLWICKKRDSTQCAVCPIFACYLLTNSKLNIKWLHYMVWQTCRPWQPLVAAPDQKHKRYYPFWCLFCNLYLLSLFLIFDVSLSGWGWRGGGPASEPVLARVQPQAPHLPLNHTNCPPPVDNAAWRQEAGVWDRVPPSQKVWNKNVVCGVLICASVSKFTIGSLFFFAFQTAKKFFPITFLGAITWIAGFSYLMVWWAHQVLYTVAKDLLTPQDMT